MCSLTTSHSRRRGTRAPKEKRLSRIHNLIPIALRGEVWIRPTRAIIQPLVQASNLAEILLHYILLVGGSREVIRQPPAGDEGVGFIPGYDFLGDVAGAAYGCYVGAGGGEHREEFRGVLPVVGDACTVCSDAVVPRCEEESYSSGAELCEFSADAAGVVDRDGLFVVGVGGGDHVWEVFLREDVGEPG